MNKGNTKKKAARGRRSGNTRVCGKTPVAEQRFVPPAGLERLLAGSGVLAVMQDPDGTYLYFNAPAGFGLTPDEVLGKRPHDLLPRQTADRLMERLKRVAATGVEMRFEDSLTMAGRTSWYDHRIMPITDSAGRLIAVGTLSTEISDWVGLENALRDSEDRFRSFLENAPDAVFIINAGTGEIAAVNRAASSLVGRPKERLVGAHHRSLYPARLAAYGEQQFRARISRAPDAGRAKSYEILVQRDDGGDVPVEISAETMEMQGKRFLFSMARDVSTRHRIEQELRETERNYHALLETIELIAVMLNTKAEIIFCNQHLLDLAGWKIEEVLGKNWFDLFVPDPAVKSVFFRAVANGAFPVHFENTIRTRSGRERIIRWSNTLLHDLDGRITATASLGEDVTDQRATEAALRMKDAALASSINAVAMSDLDGRLTYVNDAFTRLWGYAGTDLVGRSVNDFWAKPEDAMQVRRELQVRGGWTGELTAKRKDGTDFLVQLSASVVQNEKGEPFGLLASFLDITDHKAREEEQLKIQKLESIGILAGGIAHDFNNLLMAILGNISLTKLQVHPQDRQFRLLSQAEAACMQARDLSYRLLTFSRGGEPVRRPLAVPELLRPAVDEALIGSSLTADFRFEAGLPQVNADEDQLKQVIYHLVANARDAMPGGGKITVSCRATDFSGREGTAVGGGRYVEIAVQDNGSGISQEHLERVFDPYFTTKEMGSTKGRGLSLAICHSIIRKHDGVITVRSAPGKGATFFLYLPAYQKQAVAGGTSAPLAEGARVRATQVLVMEDDEWVRTVSRDFLEHLGYAVLTARDGTEALDLYRAALDNRRPVDCVILDLNVHGGKGGLETLQALREIDPDVCAIVASGFPEDPVVTNYRDFGFLGALTKPYTSESLERLLSGVLAKRGERTPAPKKRGD